MNTQVREPQTSPAGPRSERLVELSRGDRLAICDCLYGGVDWEVRLVVQGELWYRERCATWKQVVETAGRWKGALSAKGWLERT